jgi:lipid-A-disaccharide synthase
MYGLPPTAWKEHRVSKLKLYTKHVACILPFETKLLEAANVECSYVGHPIAEEIRVRTTREEFALQHGLDTGKRWLGFFPGSRSNEVKRLLPVFMQTMDLYLPEKNEFLISQASSVDSNLLGQIIAHYPTVKPHIIPRQNYDMMQHCDFLSVTSGTATLEAAYIGTPFLIVYKAQPMSYEIGKRFVKITRIGLPNIILNQDLAPELLQDDANPFLIKQKMDEIIGDKNRYDQFRKELQRIHNLLGDQSASRNTADLIEKLLS